MALAIKKDAIEKAFNEIDEAAKKLFDADKDSDDSYTEHYGKEFKDANLHKYFLDPSIVNPDIYRRPILEQVQYIPLPTRITEEMNKMVYWADMGIIPEIQRIWVAIDNKLFIWDYVVKDSIPEEYLGFDNQIVSVAIAAPKPGTFQSSVKYVVVVATTTEISLLMLTWDKGHVQLIPTQYKTPSDDIVIKKIVGSQSGRIFMGGFDGVMYELYYENIENTWPSLFRVGAHAPRFKCRKISHKSWLQWGYLGEYLIPPILRVDDGLRDICIDDARNVLYTITSKGILTVYWLGTDGNETNRLIECNFYEKIRERLSIRSEGAPTRRSFEDDSNTYFSADQKKEIGNEVLSIHVMPVAESRVCHLVAVLRNGVRVFMQLSAGRRNCFDLKPPLKPDDVTFLHIRSPPESETIECSAKGEMDDQKFISGVSPNTFPNQNGRVMNKSFYSHGIFLAATEKKSTNDLEKHDLLVGLCQDLGNVDDIKASYRENVCVVDRSRSRDQLGRIYDIKESVSQMHCSEAIKMRALFVQSRKPNQFHIGTGYNDQMEDSGSHHLRIPKWDRDGNSISEPPATTSIAIAFACQQPGLGLSKALENVAVLNNMSYHQMPTQFSMQRKFLCVTNKGLHVVANMRPIDQLYNILSNNASEELIRRHCVYFFETYGKVQAAAMCFSLACGMPSDAGGSISLDPTLPSGHVNLSVIKNLAIRVTKDLSLHEPTAYSKQLTNYDATYGHQLNWTSVEESIRCKSLRLVASRFLRPIWFRPIVQSVTKDSEDFEISPIWTRPFIHSIRQPLLELQGIIFSCYDVLIRERERQSPNENNKKLPLLMEGIKNDKESKSSSENKKLEQEAKKCESDNVFGLYRLVQRSVQALNLLDFLIKSKGVSWAKLKSRTFKAIVCNSTLHKDIKTILFGVLSRATKDDPSPTGLHLAQELTNELSENCFLFFSSGDKYAHDAQISYNKLTNDLKSAISRNDPQLIKQAKDAISQLIKASQYWQSLSDVTGSSEGTLSTYCTLLMTLGEVGRNGVVDLCLATTRNFSNSRIDETGFGSIRKKIGDGDFSPYESRNLYHLDRILDPQDMESGCKACFNVLLDQMMTLNAVRVDNFNGDNNLFAIMQMIDRALNTRELKDDRVQMKVFQQMLCERLMKQDKSLIFKLKHNFAEDYLAERDTEDLNQYYKSNKMYLEACNKMFTCACTPNNCPIETRIEFLTKALDSANEATRQGILEMLTNTGRRKTVADFIQDITSRLKLAKHQRDVYQLLSNDLQQYEKKVLSDEGERSKNALKPVIHDFNFTTVARNIIYSTALCHKMFEVCISMFQQDDDFDKNHRDEIWRSYIYR